MGLLVHIVSSPCFLLVLLSVVSFCVLCVAQDGACFNGERVDGGCQCYRGWTGSSCEHCSGRSRVESNNGTIVDHFGGGNYIANRACLFFIEAQWPASSIRLRFNHLSAECQWDYLYVFDGDSVFDAKLAAFTGNILKVDTVDDPYPVPPTPIPVRMNDTNITSTNATQEDSSRFGSSSGSGSGSGHLPFSPTPYQDPTNIMITSRGPRLLLYFYTDVGLHDLGFNLSYWVNYLCPDNCSGQGDCDETSGSCNCLPGWRGEACQEPACPNNCFENGVCNDTLRQCSCHEGYTGVDCSISLEKPHWEGADDTIFSADFEPSLLARASHSAVMWGQDMVVYGGYRFPLGDGCVDVGSGAGSGGGSGAGSGERDRVEQAEVLLYHFATHTWEVLEAQSGTKRPETRYGHSAVVYNDTLYVFGGAKTPQEEITNELWSFDLRNLVWTCLLNDTSTPSNDTTNATTNATTSLVQGGGSNSVSMATERAGRSAGGDYLPMPVRSHTAHIVGSKMVVLFGYSNHEDIFISYVQEYDIDAGAWSAPGQLGLQPAGRMGHSSVYNRESGLVYVYGGQRWRPGSRRQVDLTDELLLYDPVTHWWSQLAPSRSPRYLHSAVLFGSLMLTYGGCNYSPSENVLGDCFSSDLHIYNSVCNEWQKVNYPGLPGNAGRYGHSTLLDPTNNSTLVFGGFQGTLLSDLLRFTTGNCSVYATQEECLNGSALCAWSPGEESCTLAGQQTDLVYQCTVDSCLSRRTWSDCSSAVGCSWNTSFCRCTATDPNMSATPPTDGSQCLDDETSCYYSSCESCLVHGCLWGRTRTGSRSTSCLHPLQFNESVHETVDCTSNPCFARSSCSECVSGCLWCPSLHQCIPQNGYPYTYIYGQCLGWANQCPGECANLQTCTSCQGNINCGWCNDASNTGLGTCVEGGFLDARNESQCPGEQWHFDSCPACQCNGHSTCVNGSICEHCQDNTTGLHCEQCVNTYYGNPINGGTCIPCDCNGYNPTCNNQNGSCDCHDSGVDGDRCDSCNSQTTGDASNFCYYNLQVGFIYTFGQAIVNPRTVESQPFRTFYGCTPPNDKSLNFRFEISSNPRNHPIVIQLFLGRRSQNLWLLANLTEPITVRNRGSLDRTFGSFQGSNNVSLSNLFSFARPSIRASPNFTKLLNTAVENDYTNHLWDQDVTLVVYLVNLTDTVQYKITVDQTDLLFLLYFFSTFVTCFTVLLMAFIIGWYVKRKLEMRALIRAQFIELQRRVSRPFAKVKLVIDQKVDVNAPQHPSYVGVETCRDSKGAILTLFVRQPGEGRRGRPPPGRTGLSFGSTLVRVNPSKLKSKDRIQERKRNRGQTHTSLINST